VAKEQGINEEKSEKVSSKERLLWLPHNILAHPLMIFLPQSWGIWVHNKTIPRKSKLKERERE